MIGSGIRSMLNTMRKHNRRTVIQTAILKVEDFDVKCMAYDISLGGVRLKVDVPIEQGTDVFIQIKNKLRCAAKVIWFADGFMGLSFRENPETIKVSLGTLAVGLN